MNFRKKNLRLAEGMENHDVRQSHEDRLKRKVGNILIFLKGARVRIIQKHIKGEKCFNVVGVVNSTNMLDLNQ